MEQDYAMTTCMVLKQDVSVLQTRRVIYIVLTKGTLVIIGVKMKSQGCVAILMVQTSLIVKPNVRHRPVVATCTTPPSRANQPPTVTLAIGNWNTGQLN